MVNLHVLLLKQIIELLQRFVLFSRSGSHFTGSFKVVAKISQLFFFDPVRLRLAALVVGGGFIKVAIVTAVQVGAFRAGLIAAWLTFKLNQGLTDRDQNRFEII